LAAAERHRIRVLIRSRVVVFISTKPASEVLDGQWAETTVPLAITAEPAQPADVEDL